MQHRFRSALWALDGLRHDGWTSLAMGTVVAFAVTLLAIGPSPINGPWDVFILIDGGARVAEGQVPGVDFSNPIGPLTYVLTALPMRLDHAVGIDAFSQGDVVFLLAVSLSAVFVARRRLPGALTFAFTLFVAIIASADRPLGFPVSTTTYAMIYNRYGWVLYAILLILLFVPPVTPGRFGRAGTGFAAGLLLGALFYCKITYFVAGVGALGLSVILHEGRRKIVAGAATGLLVVLAVFYLGEGISPDAYVADILSAGRAQSDEARGAELASTLKANAMPMALLGGVLVAVVLRSLRGTARLRYIPARRLVVIVVFVMASTIALAVGNQPEGRELPAFAAAVLIIVTSLTGPRGSLLTVETLVVIALLFPPFLLWTPSKDVYARARAETTFKGHPQRFDSPRLDDFVIPSNSSRATAYWPSRDVPARINEGLRLLRSSNVGRESTVLTIALTDPFTYARQGRHAENTPLWWDLYYSFSEDEHPTSGKLFADVDYVMVPILRPTDAGCCKKTVTEMLALYGDYLDAHYAVVAQSADWKLLGRRDRVSGTAMN